MNKASIRLLIAAVAVGACSTVFARGPWRASEGNTPGWYFMTPEERIEHQAKIRSFKTYEECQAYREEHHRLMEARARVEGKTAGGGRRDFCAHLLQPGSGK